MDRLRASDQEAWRRLVRLYSPLVYYWCRQADLQSSDAADVMQETFASVARSIAGFERESSGAFRGWLFTITRNKLRDYFRRRQATIEAVGGSDAHLGLMQLDEPPGGDSASQSTAERLVVRQALELVQAEFESSTWRAFQRTAVEGLPPADVAAELGISVAAVYKAKSRVLARLRQELRGLES